LSIRRGRTSDLARILAAHRLRLLARARITSDGSVVRAAPSEHLALP
jgi:hypothetical protein